MQVDTSAVTPWQLRNFADGVGEVMASKGDLLLLADLLEAKLPQIVRDVSKPSQTTIVFDVVRDEQGLISRIIATPLE